MAPSSFSHQKPSSVEPGAKLGESDQACEVRLEAEGATTRSLLSPQRETTRCRFANGWFCKTCDRVTEHKEVKGRQVCLECGYRMGQERPDVKAKQKERQRNHQIEKLEKKL